MPMSLLYPNLISLGGQALTDEGRQPVEEQRDERSVVVDLASGKKRKYIKGIQHSWQISWEMVPISDDYTIDGHGGREEIKALAYSGATMTFTYDNNYSGSESFTVFVTNYSETLVFRRGEGNRYNIKLDLEEQG